MKNEIKLKIHEQVGSILELNLLAGKTPWSLAGVSGDRFKRSVERRDLFVKRVNAALEPLNARVSVEVVDRKTGRLGLVVYSSGGMGFNCEKEVWKW